MPGTGIRSNTKTNHGSVFGGSLYAKNNPKKCVTGSLLAFLYSDHSQMGHPDTGPIQILDLFVSGFGILFLIQFSEVRLA
jgi:hypothetical protein